MSIHRIVFSVLLSGFVVASANAQLDQRSYDLQNVTPPSPNAASLGKYADWPVNLFTGVPDISIPLYELKGRSLSVPVSLSYHASGIKVGDIPSCVGLGWSLMAGGVITRSVRGLPDDAGGTTGYLGLRAQYTNPGDLSSATTIAENDSLFRFTTARGYTDTEPDLFMFSALGRSYKFFFAGDGTIMTKPYSNLKVTMNTADSSWKVIMEDGTRLIFGGGSKYTELSASSDFETYSFVSSWYLQSITSPKGETINFRYSSTAALDVDIYAYQADYLFDYIAGGVGGGTGYVKAAQSRGTIVSVNMLTLSAIESDLARIDFDTTGRTDIPGSVAVSGIKVFSKLKSEYIERYKLYYNYSAAVSGNVYAGGATTTAYRLKLDSLEEIPSDNNAHKGWKFGYNPRILPSRKSYAQDYWGYYNGATGNTTFLPFMIAFNPDSYSYGNRSADSAAMMAEMLTKITYPTGGYSVFNYEPNSYPATEEMIQRATMYQHLYMTYNQSSFSNSQSDTIVLTRSQYFKYQITGNFSSTYMQDFGASTIIANATLRTLSGTGVSGIGLVKGDNGVTKVSASVLLNPGTYIFNTSSISPQTDFGSSLQTVDLSSSYTYTKSLGNKYVNHAVGGVRIRSIFDYDNIDTLKTVKKFYEYENAYVIAPVDSANDFLSSTTDNTWECSTGDDGTSLTSTCGFPGCLLSSIVFKTRNSSTRFSLGSIQGGTVGYGKVTEKFGTNGANGKKVYYYTTVADGNIASAKGFPYPGIISKDYERGLLTAEEVYNAGNVLISRARNNYEYLQKASITTYKAAFKINILSECYTFSYIGEIVTRIFYTDNVDQVKRVSSSQTSFNTATGDSLIASTWYYYDDSLNMQPVRTVTFNSKGDSVLSYERTALEKAAINSSMTLASAASVAVDTLLARNMVGIPLQSEKYTKGVLTSKALSNYKVQGSGLVLPDNVMSVNAANTAETRLIFSRYDVYGNLLEQQKYRDFRHDYIWDYKNTYAIAEIINGDSLSAFTSFESDGTGGWTIAGSFRDSATQALAGYKSYRLDSGSISRTGLSSGNAYIVSYWSRNGSYTVSGSTGVTTGKTISIGSVTWTYYEHSVTGVSTVTVSGSGSIDELRLYLKTAQMATYTYKPLVGIVSQCDIDNRVTYYEYDGFNRLYVVRDQDWNVLKKYCYSYNGNANACTQYYSVAKSGSFTRNNCVVGGWPSTVTYTVPAGKYYSLVSQAIADSLAQADVTVNGQAYANANATCTFYNVAKSGTFTRNNCGTGYVGGTITYTVNASTYSSTVSQAVADSLAQAAVTANGQAYANTNGTCIAVYTITSTNYTGLSGFYVQFTNTSTSAVTTFSIPAAGGSLGTLPAGTYTAYMAKTGNSTTKYIYQICTVSKAAAVTASFTSFTIGSSCNTVSVDGQ